MSKQDSPNNADEVWQILNTASLAIKGAGIPPNEFPTIAAEWLLISILSMCPDEETAERVAQQVIEVQQEILRRYKCGDPRFDNFPARRGPLQ